MFKTSNEKLEKEHEKLKEEMKKLIIESTQRKFENDHLKEQIKDNVEIITEIIEGYRNKIAKQSAEVSDRLKGDTELSELERMRRIVAVQKTALNRFEHTAQDLIDRLQEAINIMIAGLEHIKPPDHLGECEL